MVKIFSWGCPVCGKEFKSKDEVEEHMEKEHSKLDPIANLAVGYNQLPVGYPSGEDEKLGSAKQLLMVGLIVVLLFLLGFLVSWIK